VNNLLVTLFAFVLPLITKADELAYLTDLAASEQLHYIGDTRCPAPGRNSYIFSGDHNLLLVMVDDEVANDREASLCFWGALASASDIQDKGGRRS
jgi:hypothetical protein